MNERRGFLAAVLAFFGLGAFAKAEKEYPLIGANWDGEKLTDIAGQLESIKARHLANTGYVAFPMPGKFVSIVDDEQVVDWMWIPSGYIVTHMESTPVFDASGEVGGVITIKLVKNHAKA